MPRATAQGLPAITNLSRASDSFERLCMRRCRRIAGARRHDHAVLRLDLNFLLLDRCVITRFEVPAQSCASSHKLDLDT